MDFTKDPNDRRRLDREAMNQLDESGLPTICLLTDPTYGGVAASYAIIHPW